MHKEFQNKFVSECSQNKIDLVGKPNKCEVRDKYFIQKSYFIKHMLVYLYSQKNISEEKPYKWDVAKTIP